MSGVTPGQAAYELWAEVMATNGVDCEPFGKLGNVEQMAWREVEADLSYEPGSVDIPSGERDVTEFAIAAQQPPASGTSRERLALQDITAAISEHDESDVKYPAELLVSIDRIAGLALTAPALSVPQPAPELAPFDAITAENGMEFIRADLHDGLLDAVLKHADEDLNGTDQTPEQQAEHYVRWLESERERLVTLLDEGEPPTVKPADDVQPAPELAAATGEAAHRRWQETRWPDMTREAIDKNWELLTERAKTAWAAAGTPS